MISYASEILSWCERFSIGKDEAIVWNDNLGSIEPYTGYLKLIDAMRFHPVAACPPIIYYWSIKRGKYLDPSTGNTIGEEFFTTASPISWFSNLRNLIKDIIDEHFKTESNIEIHTNRRLAEKLSLIEPLYEAKVIFDLKCKLDEIIIKTSHEVKICVKDLKPSVIEKQSYLGDPKILSLESEAKQALVISCWDEEHIDKIFCRMFNSMELLR
jgi:hypothetical protein